MPESRAAALRQALIRGRRSRGAFLELAVRTEYLLGQALANHFAAGKVAAAVLQEHVIWRVPIETKLQLLRQAMTARELSDVFPFVIPVLTKLFWLRNVLAHSLEAPWSDHEDEIGYVSMHRGRITEHSLRADFLDWLWLQGDVVYDELEMISSVLEDFRFYEEDPQWYEDEEESQDLDTSANL